MQFAKLGNYADDNNLSISRNNKENIKVLLLSDFKTLTEWFYDNYMIMNPDKCSYMCFGKNNNDSDTLAFNKFNLKNNDKETNLGMKINQKLSFNSHIKPLCTKEGQKLCAPLRTLNYFDQK